LSFERPWLLGTLLLVAAGVGVYLLVQRRSERHAIRFPNLDVLAAAAAGQRSWRRHLPAGLLLLALATLAVATARPHVTRLAPVERASVILVIDTSRSMLSQDVKPSRLAAAKAAAREFLTRVPKKLRVGVIVFSGEVNVTAFPTTNHTLVRQSIDAIGPYTHFGFGGTAIGDALARAVELARDAMRDRQLASAAAPSGASVPEGAVSILFLSDGRQNRGILLPAEGARLAEEADIPVYTVALGTSGTSSPGPGPGAGSAPGGAFGSRYRAPDPATLRMISRRTGGEFFEARSQEALTSAYENLGSRLGRAPRRSEVTFAFVGAAAVVIAAAALLSPFVWPRLP
jgi:Ca-activated chloride channel family protein